MTRHIWIPQHFTEAQADVLMDTLERSQASAKKFVEAFPAPAPAEPEAKRGPKPKVPDGDIDIWLFGHVMGKDRDPKTDQWATCQLAVNGLRWFVTLAQMDQGDPAALVILGNALDRSVEAKSLPESMCGEWVYTGTALGFEKQHRYKLKLRVHEHIAKFMGPPQKFAGMTPDEVIDLLCGGCN